MSKFRIPARQCRVRVSAVVIAAGCHILLTACTAEPPPGPFIGNNPADPSQPTSTLAPDNYLGAYVGRRPVDPLSWREQNERVAPGRRP